MIQEVLISPLAWAVTICPECGLRSHSKPGKEMQHTILQQACRCGARYKVMFCTRLECRKKCSFPGIISAEEDIAVEINNISEIGVYFESDELNLDVDSSYNLRMKIADNWIDATVRIVRVNDKIAGAEFVNLGFKERKMIEAYLLSG
jgi:hypothetical protein